MLKKSCVAEVSITNKNIAQVRLIEGGKDAVYVGPEQEVTGCPTIPGLKPRVLKETAGAKFLQGDLLLQCSKEAVVILGNDESDIEWTLQHLPKEDSLITIFNPKSDEESLDCERKLELFLEKDAGCLVTLGSLFNGMECASVVFVFSNPYASHFRANFLRASVELILIDRNQQGSTFISEDELEVMPDAKVASRPDSITPQTVIFDGPKVQAVGTTAHSGSTLPGPPHNGPMGYATWERTLRGAPPPAPPPQV